MTYTHTLVIPGVGNYGQSRSNQNFGSAEEANAALAAHAGKHGLRYRLHLGE